MDSLSGVKIRNRLVTEYEGVKMPNSLTFDHPTVHGLHYLRLAAVRSAPRDMARQVVDSEDLATDAPLLESGMDSLSGVKIRNRLVTEYEGVKMPNSLTFD